MIITEMAIAELIPYANNPRKNDAAVDIVARSISEFGFKIPVIVDKNNVIVCGHTRLKAAEKLGLQKVPCIKAGDLTPDQINAFRLADNKTSEYAEWDTEKLEAELRLIQFDMTAFDFKLPEPELVEDDFDLEGALDEIEEPITKAGDVWIIGRHRLLCGDATSARDLAKLMNGKQAAIVVTDPPYNVDYSGQDGMTILNDKMTDAQFLAFLTDAHKRMFEFMKPGAPIYVFHADSEGHNFRTAFRKAGLKLAQCLIWVKSSLVLGRQDYHWRHEPILYGWKEGAAHTWCGDRTKDTVIDAGKINFTKAKKEELVKIIKELQAQLYAGTTTIYQDKPSRSDEHPTMKPVKLIGRLLANSSEPGEEIVLDPFGGSGSTLIACEQSGRTCYTLELDPKYCDVIVRRYEELTGTPARR